MSSNQQDIVRLLSKLLQLTTTSEIVWSKKSTPFDLKDSAGSDVTYLKYYETTYREERIGVGRRMAKPAINSLRALLGETNLQEEVGRTVRQNYFVILNLDGSVRWSNFSQSSALQNLVKTVEDHVENIDDILQKLLGDDDPP